MADNEKHYDKVIEIVNNNANKIRLRDAMKASIGEEYVDDRRITEQKPNKYPKILILAILLMALSFTAGIKVSNAIENVSAYYDVRDEVTRNATENLYYGQTYHEDRGELDWWYEIYQMALNVLNKESSYDIDTKIYGCYIGMKKYNKLDHMNELFSDMQIIVNSHPKSYSEDVIKVCSYPTFQEYIESKGLTLDEYEDIMKKVLMEYGKENKSSEEIDLLLDQLNGGGSR